MRKPSIRVLTMSGGLIAAVGLIWFLASRGLIEASVNIAANFTDCTTDENVAPHERDPYESAALTFARLILGGKGEDSYPLLSDIARRNATRPQYLAFVQSLAQQVPTMSDTLRVTHSYRYTMTGIVQPDQAQWGSCTLTSTGSLSDPEDLVQIWVRQIPLQSYVIVEGKGDDTIWATYLWMVPEGDKWNVEYFYVTTAALAGRSAEEISRMAQEQENKGNVFNAWMLYRGAISTLYGGPNFKYGLEGVIEKKTLALNAPSDVKGEPPYTWKSGDRSFRIVMAQASGSGRDIVLRLRQELPKWGEQSGLDAQNHLLLDLLHAMHPEYKDAFTKVVVEGVVPSHNGDGYRSVEVVKKPTN